MTSKSSDWKHKHRGLKAQEAKIEFEGWGESDFIKHILELRFEIIKLEGEAQQSESSKRDEAVISKKELSEKDFNQGWSYPTKVAFLLTFKNKPLTSEELHQLLLKMDKKYPAYPDPKATLSVYLTMSTKRGRIIAVKLPGIRAYYFALPDWVDEKANLRSVYREGLILFK